MQEVKIDRGRSGAGLARGRFARVAAALVATTVALALLAGCSSPATTTGSGTTTPKPTASATTYPLTVTDDASRTVTFAAQPKRVVSLAPANTEIVNGLGLFSEVVGVTTYDDYPAGVKNVAKVGDFTTPNLEAIAAAKPDVVLVTGGVQADVISKLEGIGAKVLVVDPQDVAGVYRAIKLVGSVLGVPAKADAVVTGMQAKMDEIRTKVAGAAPVSTFVEIGWNPLYTAGPGTLLDDLIVQAGGKNVVTEKGYVSYSVEQLVKDQPAAYLGTASSLGSVDAVAKRPGYAALAAVKAGKVFALTDDLVSRPGPRIVDGALEIAKALHPDLFK